MARGLTRALAHTVARPCRNHTGLPRTIGSIRNVLSSGRAVNPPHGGTMTTRLTLVCHAATAATRRAAFPHEDEPIIKETAKPVVRVDIALAGPEPRCRQTAELLGLNADLEPRLRDCD